jgi:hypothetical protein
MLKPSEGLHHVYPDLAIPALKTVFLEHIGGASICQQLSLLRGKALHSSVLQVVRGKLLGLQLAGRVTRMLEVRLSSKCFQTSHSLHSSLSMCRGLCDHMDSLDV